MGICVFRNRCSADLGDGPCYRQSAHKSHHAQCAYGTMEEALGEEQLEYSRPVFPFEVVVFLAKNVSIHCRHSKLSNIDARWESRCVPSRRGLSLDRRWSLAQHSDEAERDKVHETLCL